MGRRWSGADGYSAGPAGTRGLGRDRLREGQRCLGVRKIVPGMRPAHLLLWVFSRLILDFEVELLHARTECLPELLGHVDHPDDVLRPLFSIRQLYIPHVGNGLVQGIRSCVPDQRLFSIRQLYIPHVGNGLVQGIRSCVPDQRMADFCFPTFAPKVGLRPRPNRAANPKTPERLAPTPPFLPY